MPKDYARTDRVAEQIQRELAELVRLEIKDPRIRMVTLTGVEVARDYSHAKVFYTTLDGSSKAVQEGMERALDGALEKVEDREILLGESR